jgi:hypothetical protein
MGAQTHPVATYRLGGMFIHHIFLDALHSQTISRREVNPDTPRQEESVAAILTRPLRAQNVVSVHGQQPGCPGRQFRARVGHLRSLGQQLFLNDQGMGTGPTLRLRPPLPFLHKPHPPRPTPRKLVVTSTCHDLLRLIVHSTGPSSYISTLFLLLESHLFSFFFWESALFCHTAKVYSCCCHVQLWVSGRIMRPNAAFRR